MCDTFVSTPRSSAGGCMLLAKNSDREPNEAQNVTFIPAMKHKPNGRVKCTYIDIPQAAHTHAVLLSRPFWMFGGEMGVNERGVAIGNEAVFTKEPYHKKNDTLLGMDILRLALERSVTAREARDLIIELINTYGQGGVHTLGGTKYYHNSFIIADADEAYILETAGMHWVSKKVADIASISNCLTIGDDYDDASRGLEEYALLRKYTARGRAVNFQADFGDPLYTRFARGKVRASCSLGLLRAKKGGITSRDMMRILRDHNTAGPYHPGEKPMERICLHAGGIISTQTTGSMVAVMKKGRPPLVYMTGTAAPCVSIFKPHTILKKQNKYRCNSISQPYGEEGADIFGSATGSCDAKTLWWTGEHIHRRMLMKYNTLMPVIRHDRDVYEEKMVREIEKLWNARKEKDLSAACHKYAESFIAKSAAMADSIRSAYQNDPGRNEVPWWFALQWKMNNRTARIKI